MSLSEAPVTSINVLINCFFGCFSIVACSRAVRSSLSLKVMEHRIGHVTEILVYAYHAESANTAGPLIPK